MYGDRAETGCDAGNPQDHGLDEGMCMYCEEQQVIDRDEKICKECQDRADMHMATTSENEEMIEAEMRTEIKEIALDIHHGLIEVDAAVEKLCKIGQPTTFGQLRACPVEVH